MDGIESRDDGISASLKRDDAAALGAIAAIGLAGERALAHLARPVTAEHALTLLGKSRGSLSLTRPEAAALVKCADSGLALAAESEFAPLFETIDLDAARRGLAELRGAMR